MTRLGDMEYVLVDLDGASRDYFDTQRAVSAALREIGDAAEFYVLAYREGEQLGEAIRGDEWLIGEVSTGRNKKTKTQTVTLDRTSTTRVAGAGIAPPAVPA